MNQHHEFMRQAIEVARQGMKNDIGGPFGAIVVREGVVVAKGCNQVTSTNDPTAHAEVVAIREACKKLGNFKLDNCVIYTSCEPCPMCLGAIYWAGIQKIYYACTKDDAAAANFDDAFIYQELDTPKSNRKLPQECCLREEALTVFEQWRQKIDRIDY
ncbi:nucleoside deaminase [Runella sp. MFBS21]|uniref:nucleoside deaminase n=1 Tax=Runella sp. MFBS21 TaxID=3034018 RepID=UPI0023F9A438|nr:nucleoside deaminase [Runella sp. MFBS21]MDF7816691.1 nucleoside deaminase [Runella sp. MFBS21]